MKTYDITFHREISSIIISLDIALILKHKMGQRITSASWKHGLTDKPTRMTKELSDSMIKWNAYIAYWNNISSVRRLAHNDGAF